MDKNNKNGCGCGSKSEKAKGDNCAKRPETHEKQKK
jgi:hypothetical protein